MEFEGLAMAHRVHSNFSFHNSNDTKSLALLVQVLYLRCLVHVKNCVACPLRAMCFFALHGPRFALHRAWTASQRHVLLSLPGKT